MDSKVLRGLCESYQTVYDDGFESWVNSLVEEGYDLSEYTWEDMYEEYLNEMGQKGGRVTGSNPNVWKPTTTNLGPAGGGMGGRRGGGSSPGSIRPAAPKPANEPYKSRFAGARDAAFKKAQAIKGSPVVGPGSAEKPAETRPVVTKPPATPAAKSAATTGSPKVAPSSSSSNTPAAPKKTFNPLMNKTFGYQTGYAPDQIKNDPKKLAQMGSLKNISSSFEWGSTSKIVDDVADAYASIYEGKKKDQDGDNDKDFADVMIARMIASGMSRAEAIAAVKNKEYNEEYGIKVPAKATDAQALKGLIPKGSKVHEMKKKTPTLQNASYEPEADMVDEATRMRRELGKEGEIATRKELAARSRAYKRSGSVDKTIAAAEIGANRPYVKHKRGESDSDRSKREDAQSRTLRRLAASRRGSVRGNESLRGYASKVEGDDKELQSARSSARSAGTLTPAEKKKLGEEFYMWVEALIDEGYDLSKYTWDEMYDIYEETDKEREERLAARRARVREMESQGRVMTSSKRTSERTKQRREEQKAERLERLANQALADTRGVSRRSSKPMGSEEPASKPAAPEANRKLKGVVKRDTLASRADELLRMIQSEDFELWLEDLIEEGYELSEWTDDEIIDLYEEIIEEKYGTAAGRKRVAKMARSGKDIGKKGPGFQKMVNKLTPKYGKERATKIAAAQMYKTHA